MYRAEVLFDFTAQQKGDLSVTRGDVLNVLSEYDGTWCKAENKGKKGKKGAVPLSYITPIDPTQERCDTFRALYDFNSRNAVELSFKEGDFVTIINYDPSRNWLKGELNGHRGIVPSNYLEACSPQALKGETDSLQVKTHGLPTAPRRTSKTAKTKRLSLVLDNMESPKPASLRRKGHHSGADSVESPDSPVGNGERLSRSLSSTLLSSSKPPKSKYASYPFEEPDSEKNSAYRDGVFVGGNIHKIIGYLTTDKTPLDENRMDEMRYFSLSHRMSITSDQLMECIIQRFDVPRNLGFTEEKIKTIQINTLTLLRKWVGVNNYIKYLFILIDFYSFNQLTN